jgi:F1F0 ATPase subunit 2
MNELVPLLPVGLGGGTLLGLLFFGGLWWTTRRVLASPRPWRLLFASLVLRTTAVLAGFGALSLWRWEAAALGLVGFVLARLVLMGFLPAGPIKKEP